LITDIFKKEEINNSPIVKICYQDFEEDIKPVGALNEISITIKERDIDLKDYEVKSDYDIAQIIRNYAYNSLCEINFNPKMLKEKSFKDTLLRTIARVKNEIFTKTRQLPQHILVGDWQIHYLLLNNVPSTTFHLCEHLREDEIIILTANNEIANPFRYLYNDHVEAFIPIDDAEHSVSVIRLLDKRQILFNKLQKIKE